MPAYFFNLDTIIVQGDQRSYTLTWTDTSGNAVDITTWDFYFRAESTKTTDTLSVAPVSVVKSDSGSGTTDTCEIPFSEAQTDIDPGYYKQEISVDRGNNINTVAKGTLTIIERVTEV